jgi:hypothetical protein
MKPMLTKKMRWEVSLFLAGLFVFLQFSCSGCVGHGTHVVSSIVGDAESDDDEEDVVKAREYNGMAPKASVSVA